MLKNGSEWHWFLLYQGAAISPLECLHSTLGTRSWDVLMWASNSGLSFQATNFLGCIETPRTFTNRQSTIANHRDSKCMLFVKVNNRTKADAAFEVVSYLEKAFVRSKKKIRRWVPHHQETTRTPTNINQYIKSRLRLFARDTSKILEAIGCFFNRQSCQATHKPNTHIDEKQRLLCRWWVCGMMFCALGFIRMYLFPTKNPGWKETKTHSRYCSCPCLYLYSLQQSKVNFDLVRNDDLSRWNCFCLLFLSMVEIHFDCSLDCSDSETIRIILSENMKNHTSRTEELSVQSKCILTIVNTNWLILDETCANLIYRIIGLRYGFSRLSLYVWSFHSNTSHFASMIATTTK